jgi:tRNA pseudouridine55 synthase
LGNSKAIHQTVEDSIPDRSGLAKLLNSTITQLPNYQIAPMNGVLIIDKPGGFTSHDVVNRVRRILEQRSVGHLGTLDPLATGVLPLVIGNLTRLARFYTTSEKSYEGVIRFGFATDTYDAEGEPAALAQSVSLDLDQVVTLAATFHGVIEQMPPPFSAKKIHGVPAYKLARKKKEVVLQPVQVEIKEFEILAVEGDRARFRARVASGTYMRSVAHEMGQKLGCGAHLESLRRTAVAEFTIENAHTLEELQEVAKSKAAQTVEGNPARKPTDEAMAEEAEIDDASSPGALELLFVHPRLLLPQFPSVTADEGNTARIRAGRPVNLPEFSRARQVKIFSNQRDLIAIAARVAGTLFHPRIVLADSEGSSS